MVNNPTTRRVGSLKGSGMAVAQLASMLEGFTKRIPMHRMGTPDDIAKVALFLASSGAVVDGGMLLR